MMAYIIFMLVMILILICLEIDMISNGKIGDKLEELACKVGKYLEEKGLL